MSHQARVPAMVADYFGHDVVRDDHPVIGMTFTPGKGWIRTRSTHKRVSLSWLRKLRAEGVTAVLLDCNGRAADFGVVEIIRHSERLARQPLIGGRLI